MTDGGWWKDCFFYENRAPEFKNFQGRAERMVQRRGCWLRTEDTKCIPRANSPSLTWLPICNWRIHITSLPSWTFREVNASKAARSMELCYSKSRKVYSAGRSFKNCMAKRVETCKLKNGWILVKCASVRSVSPFYEKFGGGWVPARSVVLQDLSCSWVVQVSAQLLSSPPDNALSWGKE